MILTMACISIYFIFTNFREQFEIMRGHRCSLLEIPLVYYIQTIFEKEIAVKQFFYIIKKQFECLDYFNTSLTT